MARSYYRGMYRYDPYDHALVADRVAQFRGQTQRHLAGELSEDEFRPLRLQNGLYIQRHGPMLRVAIPYGLLSSHQLRRLAHIARRYDRGYGHFTTRQNLQYNWPKLEAVPDILAELAGVEMHAIQHPAQFLARCKFFSGLDLLQLAPLAAVSQWEHYTTGVNIYDSGDHGDFLYVLADGRVNFKLALGRHEANAGEVMRPGDVFGWAALIEGAHSRLASARCITPCRVLAIDGSALLQLMASDSDLGYEIMKQLCLLITTRMMACAAA